MKFEKLENALSHFQLCAYNSNREAIYYIFSYSKQAEDCTKSVLNQQCLVAKFTVNYDDYLSNDKSVKREYFAAFDAREIEALEKHYDADYIVTDCIDAMFDLASHYHLREEKLDIRDFDDNTHQAAVFYSDIDELYDRENDICYELT